MIAELDYDMLKEISIRVARSSDGAKNFARAISVCKSFRKLVEDEDVLKAVVFDRLLLSKRYELFQPINGLVNRCAQAGNTEAQFILAKVILVSSSQLYSEKLMIIMRKSQASSCHDASIGNAGIVKPCKERFLASSFMGYFMPDQDYATEAPHRNLFHFQVVRLFLIQGSPSEITKMQIHLNNYVRFFFEKELRCSEFLSQLIELYACGEALEQERIWMEKGLLHVVEILTQYDGSHQMQFNNVPSIPSYLWDDPFETDGGNSKTGMSVVEELESQFERLRDDIICMFDLLCLRFSGGK
ncbi:hypothetical protein Ancab_008524 [Ancistrocladus abbreviatus]